MLTSLWRGLDEADARGVDAVLVHPVDNPIVLPATVGAVLVATLSGAAVAVPTYAGRRGHPTAFARLTWSAVRAASPAKGAGQVSRDNSAWIVHVPAGCDCLADFDLPTDLLSAR